MQIGLENAERIANILNPIIVVLVGFFVTLVINRYSQRFSANSEFQTRWTRIAIDKVFEFSDTATRIIVYLHTLQGANDDEKIGSIVASIGEDVEKMQLLYYEIEVHAKLFENPERLVVPCEKIFRLIQSILAERRGNVDEVKEAQSELIRIVRDLQQEAVGIDQ